MLEMLLDKKLLFVLMGILTGLGVVDKCIVSMTMKRMVEAAGSMSKSNHPLMRLVRAKFEHACMISDTVENVGVFIQEKRLMKNLWISICMSIKSVDYDFTRCADWRRYVWDCLS